MKTYPIRIKHEGTGIVYVVPVLAASLEEARRKAVDWPYAEFCRYVLADCSRTGGPGPRTPPRGRSVIRSPSHRPRASVLGPRT